MLLLADIDDQFRKYKIIYGYKAVFHGFIYKFAVGKQPIS